MSGLTKSALLILILLVILNSFTETTKDLYKLIATRMTCEDVDPRIIYNHSCSTEKNGRGPKSFSLVVIPHPNMSFNQVFVRVDYFQRIGPIYNRFLGSLEENFCSFLAGRSKGHLIKILWPAIRSSSNLDHKCPLSGIFNVSHVVFDETHLPPALPEGEARIDIHVRNGSERLSLIKVKLYVEIKPIGAAKLEF